MTQSTSDLNVSRIEPLIQPHELLDQLPLTPSAARTVMSGRQQVEAILRGEDQRMIVIVGPCSIHDERAAIEYAERLLELSASVQDRMLPIMRVYFEKPRTTVGWKGFIYDPHLDDSYDVQLGLSKARELLIRLSEMGVLTATEFLDPIVPQYISDTITWAAIGARTTESQTHRQMASGLSMPIGFKNNTDGNVQVAVDAVISARTPHAFLGIDKSGRASIVYTKGNQYSHVVLRGGLRGANYEADSIAEGAGRLEAVGLPPRLIVDCSHANSEKDHSRQSIAFREVLRQRLNGNGNIIGVMVESHLHEGSQKLGSDPSTLQYGVSITDACIGWKETESLLTEAYEGLALQPVG